MCKRTSQLGKRRKTTLATQNSSRKLVLKKVEFFPRLQAENHTVKTFFNEIHNAVSIESIALAQTLTKQQNL